VGNAALKHVDGVHFWHASSWILGNFMKTLFIFVLVAGLSAGFFIGRYQTGRAWRRYAEHHFIHLKAANDTDGYVRVLTYLKEGKQTNALDVLEILLNSSLSSLDSYEGIPPEGRDEFALRAIEVAREYRARYPWAGSSPEVNDRVKQILASVDGGSGLRHLVTAR
jgi:hypothetical protein